MQIRSAIILTLLLLVPSSLLAGNWAHWRGPTGNSVAPEATPPTQWSANENIKWKVAIPGRGSGSPVVWDDRVFVVTAVGASGGSERLAFKILCYDRATGKLIWQQTATVATPHQGTHRTNGHASASPCTDGQHVYAHFGSRGIYCYTMDGKLVWKRDDLGRMQTRASFGEGSSPTIAGNKIIVPWDHEGPSYLLALNKLTGETVWKTPRDEPSCWATPLIVSHVAGTQIIMNGQTCARSYDLATGKELWRCGGQTSRPIASAVAANGRVFIGSGYQGSYLAAFTLDGSGDIEGTDKVIWDITRDTPDVASPLLSGNRLYFHDGKSAGISCVDAASGKLLFSQLRIPGVSKTYASPFAANGNVYITGRNGTTVVIRDADQYQLISTNVLGEPVDATPAPVDNELFIRGERHLFCISQ